MFGGGAQLFYSLRGGSLSHTLKTPDLENWIMLFC